MADVLTEAQVRELHERGEVIRRWLPKPDESRFPREWQAGQHAAHESLDALLAEVQQLRGERDRAIFVGKTNDDSYSQMRAHYDKRLALCCCFLVACRRRSPSSVERQ